MNKTVHGAIIGLLVGGPAMLLISQFYVMLGKSVENGGHGGGVILLGIIGWTLWGAILGTILPKHK